VTADEEVLAPAELAGVLLLEPHAAMPMATVERPAHFRKFLREIFFIL
jgi:hypothetical protein